MNEGTPNEARSHPASAPHAAPRISVAATAPRTPSPHCALPIATSTEANATAGPMLMSMSPAITTSVTPHAAMPMVAASRRMPSWFAPSRKPAAVRPRTTYSTAMATTRPISFSWWVRELNQPRAAGFPSDGRFLSMVTTVVLFSCGSVSRGHGGSEDGVDGDVRAGQFVGDAPTTEGDDAITHER